MKEDNKRIFILMIVIMGVVILVAGGTFAYFAFRTSNNNTITGSMGSVDLSLTVTKELPSTSGVDDILVTNFSELPDNLNSKCIDRDGEYALCQLYKIVLSNSSNGVNTKVKGSVSFNNTTSPNLSWIRIDNYSSSTTYTSNTLGSSYHTASSNFDSFESSYLLKSGNSVTYYILVWVNENEEEQTDTGTYTGTVRFEDENGKGVTSTFGA